MSFKKFVNRQLKLNPRGIKKNLSVLSGANRLNDWQSDKNQRETDNET